MTAVWADSWTRGLRASPSFHLVRYHSNQTSSCTNLLCENLTQAELATHAKTMADNHAEQVLNRVGACSRQRRGVERDF